ncbi:MAG: NAD kinase [Chitinophagales bacterium]|nr:NAD kinase [Chitinophagales bacterium]
MKVAVYGRSSNEKVLNFLINLLGKLEDLNIDYTLYEPFYKHFKDHNALITHDPEVFNTHMEIRKDVDYIFSLGGDGTLLHTLEFVNDSGIPILGINLGRLGFLSSITTDELDLAMQAILKGNYVIEKKSLLSLTCNKEIFKSTPYAMNEFTIQRKDTFTMITVHTFINGELLNTYWADGVIIATPTGSTGYSLSCNGPIIYPNCNNFVVTPVAPHNLYVRPIVVPDDVVISFEVEGRNDSFYATLDSRKEVIDSSYQIAVKKASFTANLLRLNDASFLNAIRDKLMWGQDQRN